DSTIGDQVIVNTSATVDHDCRIGSYAHVAPGANLCGGVTVGEGVLVGTGAKLLPNCSVGEWATIGAGAVVVGDIPAGAVARGVPARWSSAGATSAHVR